MIQHNGVTFQSDSFDVPEEYPFCYDSARHTRKHNESIANSVTSWYGEEENDNEHRSHNRVSSQVNEVQPPVEMSATPVCTPEVEWISVEGIHSAAAGSNTWSQHYPVTTAYRKSAHDDERTLSLLDFRTHNLNETKRARESKRKQFSRHRCEPEQRQQRQRQRSRERPRSVSVARDVCLSCLLYCEHFVVALAVGLTLGGVGVFIDASSSWVDALRSGVCANFFWLNKEFCCMGGEEKSSACQDYYTWGEYMLASLFTVNQSSDRGTRNYYQIISDHSTRYYTYTVFVWIVDFIAYVALSVATATAASFLCVRYAPFAAGGGIAEVRTIVSGYHRPRYLSLPTLLTKAVAVCLSTGAGLMVGKEGPLVHMGACIGALFAQLASYLHRAPHSILKYADNKHHCHASSNTNSYANTDNYNDNSSNPTDANDDCHFNYSKMHTAHYNKEVISREFIIAGAGGGVAVAFGAPVGGVLFALEEVTLMYHFGVMMTTLMCGLTAVLLQSYLDLWHRPALVQFRVNDTSSWHLFEIPLFILVGSSAGALGALCNVMHLRILRWRRRRWGHCRVAEVAVVSAITAVLNFVLPFADRDNLNVLARCFQDCMEPPAERRFNNLYINDHASGRYVNISRRVKRYSSYDASHILSNAIASIKSSSPTSSSSPLMCDSDSTDNAASLLLTALIKGTLFVYSSGLFLPAGVLVPSLLAGALFGRGCGMLFRKLQYQYWPALLLKRIASDCYCGSSSDSSSTMQDAACPSGCIIPSLYAMVGAAAMLTGVTRMTLCLVVIMFELTGSLNYLVPVMIAIFAAKMVADSLGVDGMHELLAQENELPYLHTPRSGSSVAEALRPCVAADVYAGRCFSVLTLRGMTVEQVWHLVQGTSVKGFPLVRAAEDATLLGYVSRRLLAQALRVVVRQDGQVGMQTPVSFDDDEDEDEEHKLQNEEEEFGNELLSGCIIVPTTQEEETQREFARTTTTATTILSTREEASADSAMRANATDERGGRQDRATVVNLSALVQSCTTQVEPKCPVSCVLSLFRALGVHHILVSHRSKFEGYISKKDLIVFMRSKESKRRMR